mmetsp:Transcript_8708/g.21004  ORF Transcript_8708/g.21004 Transcript_8708/m.21004 type:complete len:206 (+) Transcript_8708:2569-3186(+)
MAAAIWLRSAASGFGARSPSASAAPRFRARTCTVASSRRAGPQTPTTAASSLAWTVSWKAGAPPPVASSAQTDLLGASPPLQNCAAQSPGLAMQANSSPAHGSRPGLASHRQVAHRLTLVRSRDLNLSPTMGRARQPEHRKPSCRGFKSAAVPAKRTHWFNLAFPWKKPLESVSFSSRFAQQVELPCNDLCWATSASQERSLLLI